MSGSGVSYDAAGDTTNDGVTTYTLDAEGPIVTATNGSSGTSTYVDDAEGRRVRKTVNGTSKDFLYDLADHEITEINSSGGWNRGEVYAGGRHLATYANGTTYFIHADWLGTERARSTVAGASYETCTSLPFGDWLTCSGGDPSPMHFTGKEHDNETGLDNFGARYDASSMGRFMTPDPLGGKRVDPQTLNKYSYVRNNPLTLTDPTGLYTCADDQNKCQTQQDVAFEAARQNDLKSKDPDVARAASAYGDPTKDNGVNVSFQDLSKNKEGGATTSSLGTDDKGSLQAKSNVVIDSNLKPGTVLDAAVAHEGSHAADAQDLVKSIVINNDGTFKVGQDITQYASEQRAYHVTDSIFKTSNESHQFYCGRTNCTLGAGVLGDAQVTTQIDSILYYNYRSSINKQPLTPSNQGGSIVPH